MSGILVFVEHTGGEVDRLSREALTLARRLAGSNGVEALLVGEGAGEAASKLGVDGVQSAHVVEDARLTPYAPAAWGAALNELVSARGPDGVLAGGSDRGNEVLAHAAARSGRPMVANVVDATPGSPWRLARQRWAGSLLEDAELDADVALMTVAPHVVPIAGGSAAAQVAVTPFSPAVSDRDLISQVVGREEKTTAGVSLADAKVVIGGGRGVGSTEGFATLQELADLLGGAVGGSRVVTSAGWRPHSDQIGQTGLRIAPDLYVACGISGAIQHIVGCKAAKRILAINTDPDSPIMGVADYAVIGDLHQVLPAISAEIRRRTGATG